MLVHNVVTKCFTLLMTNVALDTFFNKWYDCVSCRLDVCQCKSLRILWHQILFRSQIWVIVWLFRDTILLKLYLLLDGLNMQQFVFFIFNENLYWQIIYKQDMWRVYKHTRKDKDYEVYKYAWNEATHEVRNSKRNVEQKLAHHMKSVCKSWYAYVRSKQNARDKVGRLDDNAGNIITHIFVMAE